MIKKRRVYEPRSECGGASIHIDALARQRWQNPGREMGAPGFEAVRSEKCGG